MATLKTGWLLNKSGEKFAPKTLLSQVSTDDGVLLEQKLNEIEEKIDSSRIVLWTNSDKTQPMEANTVLFPFSVDDYEQYEFYLVTYCDSTTSENSPKQLLMARSDGVGNGNNVRLNAVIKEGTTYHYHERTLAYSYGSNAFVVAQCTYIDANFNAQTTNDKLIPYQIVGIR